MLSLSFLRYNARYLAFGFLLNFSSFFGQTPFIALFAGDIRAAYGLSHGEFGGLYLLATVASAISLALYGRLADRLNLAFLGAVALGGLAVMALGMAFANSIVLLTLVLYGLRLFGQGMTGHVALTAIARWYSQSRGRALGITGLGNPVGQGLFPLITVLIVAAFGWRQAWIVGAGYLIVMVPLVFLLARRQGAGETEPVPRAAGARPALRHWSRSEVLRDPLFYALLPGMLAPPFMSTGVFFHQVHLVESKGWTLTWFASGYPVYSLATVLMSLVTGWAIDRYRCGRILPYYLLPLATGLWILGLVEAPWAVTAFMILGGISSGIAMTLLGAIWAELYGTDNLGAIRSVIMGGMVLATALAPGLMGWLIDAGIAIEHQLYTMAVYAYASALLFWLLCRRVARLR